MSEEGFRGGIGATDAVIDVSKQPAGQQSRSTEWVEQLIEAALAPVLAALDQSRAETEGLRQQIVQVQGENQQIVNACAQYQQAIVDHNNKLNALAAATSRNYRVEAARIAGNCRQTGDSVERMRQLTQMWLEIFEAPQEPPSGDIPRAHNDTRANPDDGEIPRGIFVPPRDTSKDN